MCPDVRVRRGALSRMLLSLTARNSDLQSGLTVDGSFHSGLDYRGRETEAAG